MQAFAIDVNDTALRRLELLLTDKVLPHLLGPICLEELPALLTAATVWLFVLLTHEVVLLDLLQAVDVVNVVDVVDVVVAVATLVTFVAAVVCAVAVVTVLVVEIAADGDERNVGEDEADDISTIVIGLIVSRDRSIFSLEFMLGC